MKKKHFRVLLGMIATFTLFALMGVSAKANVTTYKILGGTEATFQANPGLVSADGEGTIVTMTKSAIDSTAPSNPNPVPIPTESKVGKINGIYTNDGKATVNYKSPYQGTVMSKVTADNFKAYLGDFTFAANPDTKVVYDSLNDASKNFTISDFVSKSIQYGFMGNGTDTGKMDDATKIAIFNSLFNVTILRDGKVVLPTTPVSSAKYTPDSSGTYEVIFDLNTSNQTVKSSLDNYNGPSEVQVGKAAVYTNKNNSNDNIVLAPIRTSFTVKAPSTPTPTPTPEQPKPNPEPTPEPTPEPKPDLNDGLVPVKGEAVYSMKPIYLYKNANFKKFERKVFYAKKPRINRPMFVVINYVRDNNGRLRYYVKDVNHNSKTAGKVGYITAKSSYVRPVYYRGAHSSLTVINPTGVNEYKNKNLTGKVKNYKQGTVLKTKDIVRHNLTSRYILLANGNYITGNRKFVNMTKVKQPKQITVKKTIKLYKDVNFKHAKKYIRKGAKLTVKRYEYSRKNDMNKTGALRYAVAGGYVTGNSSFVKVTK
ncbi:DUF5776 domain-containing protein [Lentilactobacillus sp. Marseille-Q4993]|uniref:DUF5776 domain-containing protein n=1 Tax=Lentilactobacillus sp. Marseille-Q4993 TaxID=3039492 RepID=UPI0024BC7FBE|nr:DUF5776 domain-containing protein [Lentilactobacillus sp. Marseille-Q4993]